MKLQYKIWLEKNGEQVFGDGIYRLLMLVDELGSINQAAYVEKMSYRQAWGKIKRIEKRLNMRLLDRRRGGETGGGAMLTVAGKKLMREYREVLKQVNISIKQISEDFNVRIKSIAGD
ncbi:MAG: winged helix-turn-helix domain-containing protein [Tepidanaerobacteraceae bacterium]